MSSKRGSKSKNKPATKDAQEEEVGERAADTLSKLGELYLNSQADIPDDDSFNKHQKVHWDHLNHKQQEEVVIDFMRFVLLSMQCGGGVVDEQDLRKEVLGERYKDVGVAIPLSKANRRLRKQFGMELVQAWKTLTEDDKEEDGSYEVIKLKHHVVRLVTDDKDHLKALASDNKQTAKMGLLMTCLALAMTSPNQCIPEEDLFDHLIKLDPSLGPRRDADDDDDGATKELSDWKEIIKEEFVKQKWLDRRSEKDDGPSATSDAQSKTRWVLRMGPRARMTIGAPAVASFILDLSESGVRIANEDKIRELMGPEYAGMEDLFKEIARMEDSDDLVVPAGAASSKKARRE